MLDMDFVISSNIYDLFKAKINEKISQSSRYSLYKSNMENKLTKESLEGMRLLQMKILDSQNEAKIELDLREMRVEENFFEESSNFGNHNFAFYCFY